MSLGSDFVRTIKNTNLGGSKLNKNTDKKEPHYTNKQNWLLSDDQDVFIRNNDEYHCLTDNIKTIESSNDNTIQVGISKNQAQIKTQIANETDIVNATGFKIVTPPMAKRAVQEHETETLVRSEDIYIMVEKKHIEESNTDIFEVYIDMQELYSFLVDQLKADGYITDPVDEGDGDTDE